MKLGNIYKNVSVFTSHTHIATYLNHVLCVLFTFIKRSCVESYCYFISSVYSYSSVTIDHAFIIFTVQVYHNSNSIYQLTSFCLQFRTKYAVSINLKNGSERFSHGLGVMSRKVAG